MHPVVESLRELAADRKAKLLTLSQSTGLSLSVLHRYLKGASAGEQLVTVDRIAEAFGYRLELVPIPKKTKATRAKT